MLKAQSRNPRGGAAPQERLGRGKGSGRARDVVRGQDGHDDGNNMMRAPSRRLSAPMNKDLKGEGGCAWPPPPALGSPNQKQFCASQFKVQPGDTPPKLQAWHRHSEHAEGRKAGKT